MIISDSKETLRERESQPVNNWDGVNPDQLRINRVMALKVGYIRNRVNKNIYDTRYE